MLIASQDSQQSPDYRVWVIRAREHSRAHCLDALPEHVLLSHRRNYKHRLAGQEQGRRRAVIAICDCVAAQRTLPPPPLAGAERCFHTRTGFPQQLPATARLVRAEPMFP
jgi:hypothetical protein